MQFDNMPTLVNDLHKTYNQSLLKVLISEFALKYMQGVILALPMGTTVFWLNHIAGVDSFWQISCQKAIID